MDLKSKTAKEIWKRAEEIIPGGNGLLSKRPDRYAPDIWPTYFKKCKGVLVTDNAGAFFHRAAIPQCDREGRR